MPSDLRARDNAKLARTRRAVALKRSEIGKPTEPRLPAVGVTSMAVKADDPETRRLIAEFEARRGMG